MTGVMVKGVHLKYSNKQKHGKMIDTVETFKELVQVGETVDIATSEYSIDPNPHTGWKPQLRMHHSTVKSMEKKGVVSAEYFWRGCTVTRIK